MKRKKIYFEEFAEVYGFAFAVIFFHEILPDDFFDKLTFKQCLEICHKRRHDYKIENKFFQKLGARMESLVKQLQNIEDLLEAHRLGIDLPIMNGHTYHYLRQTIDDILITDYMQTFEQCLLIQQKILCESWHAYSEEKIAVECNKKICEHAKILQDWIVIGVNVKNEQVKKQAIEKVIIAIKKINTFEQLMKFKRKLLLEDRLHASFEFQYKEYERSNIDKEIDKKALELAECIESTEEWKFAYENFGFLKAMAEKLKEKKQVLLKNQELTFAKGKNVHQKKAKKGIKGKS